MTLGGWLVMFASVGFVTGLLGWCIVRILRVPRPATCRAAPGEIDSEQPQP